MANETAARARQKTKPQPTAHPRPLREAIDSIDWEASPAGGFKYARQMGLILDVTWGVGKFIY